MSARTSAAPWTLWLYGGPALLSGALWLYVEPVAELLGRPTPRFGILLAITALLFMTLWEREWERQRRAASRSPQP